MSEKTEKSYSVNLPQTAFPMKANSTVREVEIQKFWQDEQVYEKNLEARKNGTKFVLHDGPPYLSSSKIHIGTALNKILKDIVTKYKAQRGFYSPYVPGYDSHGLPIENAVLKDVKGGRNSMTAVELRQRCKEFALANLKGQEENFKRLGVWGDWAHPYITLDQKFEAAQVRVFGKMAAAGYLYKGLKPVSWCPTCETALAEAEVEYADHTSDAIFVKFSVAADSLAKLPAAVQGKGDVSFVIWTTTPWTLPANLGVAVHPQFNYVFVQTKEHGVLVVAESLKSAVFSACAIDETTTQVLAVAKGSELDRLNVKHPFIERQSLVMCGEHVTDDTGTGCVHTAPGHGPDDFILGNKYKIGVLSPVDGRGIFTEEGGKFAGSRYDKANPLVIEHLQELGRLLNHAKISHSYPHCWRCKKPLIFRATEQWFASVDGFRKQALAAIDQVEWIPATGRNRIYAMVEKRSDWCISRQRSWGVPIPVFYSKKTGKPILSELVINKVADIFEKEGSDSWWKHEPAYFLGAEFKCEDGGSEFEKETDIMDVWFDSGVTHSSVLDARPELKGSPCELYLEGSDQHRGWFQSSLLTSVAVHGRAPYKTVLTHGFVVDESGRKMSKSVGNVVAPEEVIKQYGADVLRLWVASVNYTDDIPIGKNMLAQLAEIYRKLRNTARYMLGNLNDFNPAQDKVSYDELTGLDKYILHRLQEVIAQLQEDFDRFEFFKYYQVLQNFCVVDLSSFYFDIVKDRLYTRARKSVNRRAVQTVLYEVLDCLARVLVPVTPHLAEDIWQHSPEALRSKHKSALLSDFPSVNQELTKSELDDFWKDLITVRYVVNKALEQARAERKIGSSLEAQVFLQLQDAAVAAKVSSFDSNLKELFITSGAAVTSNGNKPQQAEILSEAAESGVTVWVLKAEGSKCGRCWKYLPEVGSSAKFPELCTVCQEAVETDAVPA
ncbi:MAG: isoleucine--tRNA ligase [Candidatus Obscuribacterales bacterium]|nr:isoleucine--tRNA ligase [Candidatus Obscuribacterales bacterium]